MSSILVPTDVPSSKWGGAHCHHHGLHPPHTQFTFPAPRQKIRVHWAWTEAVCSQLVTTSPSHRGSRASRPLPRRNVYCFTITKWAGLQRGKTELLVESPPFLPSLMGTAAHPCIPVSGTHVVGHTTEGPAGTRWCGQGGYKYESVYSPPSRRLGGWLAQVQTERWCPSSRGTGRLCLLGTDGPQSNEPGASTSAHGSPRS